MSSSPTGQRPGGLTALGVLNIIFGSLGGLGILVKARRLIATKLWGDAILPNLLVRQGLQRLAATQISPPPGFVARNRVSPANDNSAIA